MGAGQPGATKTDALGLTSAEVEQRRLDGRGNKLPPRTGKTVGQIVRQNVFTRINAILFVLFVMVMTTGSRLSTALLACLSWSTPRLVSCRSCVRSTRLSR
ncbi:cation-transporting P-type ATPase [Trueperella pyogenes]